MKCTFCSKEVGDGKGKIYIKDDGKVWNFCSKKCEVNHIKLRRKGRTVKWTNTSREEKK